MARQQRWLVRQRNLMARLVIIGRERRIKMEDLMVYTLGPMPLSLADQDGGLMIWLNPFALMILHDSWDYSRISLEVGALSKVYLNSLNAIAVILSIIKIYCRNRDKGYKTRMDCEDRKITCQLISSWRTPTLVTSLCVDSLLIRHTILTQYLVWLRPGYG